MVEEEGDFEVCQFLCDVLLNLDLHCEFFIIDNTKPPLGRRRRATQAAYLREISQQFRESFSPRKIQILAPRGWLTATYVALLTKEPKVF